MKGQRKEDDSKRHQHCKDGASEGCHGHEQTDFPGQSEK